MRSAWPRALSIASVDGRGGLVEVGGDSALFEERRDWHLDRSQHFLAQIWLSAAKSTCNEVLSPRLKPIEPKSRVHLVWIAKHTASLIYCSRYSKNTKPSNCCSVHCYGYASLWEDIEKKESLSMLLR